MCWLVCYCVVGVLVCWPVCWSVCWRGSMWKYIVLCVCMCECALLSDTWHAVYVGLFFNKRPVILYCCSRSRCSKSCKRKIDELNLTYQQPTARQTSSQKGKRQTSFILSFKINTRNLFQKYQLVVFCNTQAWVVRSQARGRAEITFDTWHILQLMLSLRVRALYIAFRLTSSLYTFKTKFFKPLLIFSLHLCCINQNIFSTNSGTSGVASRGHNPWLRAGWDGTSGDNP